MHNKSNGYRNVKMCIEINFFQPTDVKQFVMPVWNRINATYWLLLSSSSTLLSNCMGSCTCHIMCKCFIETVTYKVSVTNVWWAPNPAFIFTKYLFHECILQQPNIFPHLNIRFSNKERKSPRSVRCWRGIKAPTHTMQWFIPIFFTRKF